MDGLHSLLRRQMERHLLLADPAAETRLGAFLTSVSAAYFELDRNKAFVEHTLDVLSREFEGINGDLRNELTVRRQAERQLEQSLSMLTATLESTVDGIVAIGEDGQVHFFNTQFLQLMGLSERRLRKRNANALTRRMRALVKEPERFLEHARQLQNSGRAWQDGIETTDGRFFEYQAQPWEASATLRGQVWSWRDVTQRRQHESRLAFLAQFDPLTGLVNRHLFNDRLEQSMQRSSRDGCQMALMFLDLDRFKWINDTHGHHAGDQVLREIASRLRGQVRALDTVARLGGDEFTVILEHLSDLDEARLVADKILGAVDMPVCIDSKEFYVTASVGIVMYPDATIADAGDMLKKADMAMYRAKALGRANWQFYCSGMGHTVMLQHDMSALLRRAMERDEFRLVYQPQQDLSSGQVVGVEALLRWHNPDLGIVPPMQFIPLAEETGQIVQIGEWVLRTALCQLKQWRMNGMAPIRMAVNLSTRQLRQRDLVERVAGILDDTGLPGTCLELELTESALLENMASCVDVLQRLAALGVHVAIDDFGTGYSSLSYLRHLPVSCLKIDSSFVGEMHTDAKSASLVDSIVLLAHRLSFSVVAEGVETEAQRTMLRSCGCDVVQGYLVSKPLPPAEVETLMARQSMPTARRRKGKGTADDPATSRLPAVPSIASV